MLHIKFGKNANQEVDEEEEFDDDTVMTAQPLSRRLLGRIFQPKWLVIAALIGVALVMFPKVKAIKTNLQDRREYIITMDDVRISEPPPHVPHDFISGVYFRSQLPRQLSLLDESTLLKFADAFIADPWVADIRRVQKDFPSYIYLDIVYRTPAAMVKVGDGLYPIDEAGIVLPPQNFTRDEALRYPIITNVRSVPSGANGTPFGDPVVHGAARLARALTPIDQPGESVWNRFDLAEIRVPRMQSPDEPIDDLIFELGTNSGSTIVWGRAPGIAHPAELTVAQKIGRLESYVASYGGFDQQDLAYELDIRHWKEISRRAIATRPEQVQRH